MENRIDADSMANEIRFFISSRRDKKEEVLLKDKPKKGVGGINARLLSFAESRLSKSLDDLDDIKKIKKDKKQTALKFQQDKYQKFINLLTDYQLDSQLLGIISEYKETLLKLEEKHKPNVWLSEHAIKAKDISFATHVGKLTHSSSKSSSVYDKTSSINDLYLTTNTLIDFFVDTAVSNAASAPAGEILTIKVGTKSLLDFIKNDDSSPFSLLSDNLDEVNFWMTGFKQAYDSDRKSSHFLAKQIYYPVNNDYHLLMPLVSSSIAHELFSRFRFSEDKKLISKQKDVDKYHPDLFIFYPNKATLNVTGSNHSNASSLNGKRLGKLALLSCAPPKWKSKNKFSLEQVSLFNRSLNYKLADEIKNLQRLLLIIKSKEISPKNPDMHRAITKNINELADAFFDEVLIINSLGYDKGWTQHSSLDIHQQLILEVDRNDEEAVAEKLSKQWLLKLADEFAYWLNERLNEHQNLDLNTTHQALWQALFKEPLREFVALQEDN